MKKVLVTGANGFVGGVFCRTFAAEGHDVLGLDMTIPATPCSYRQIQTDLLTADLMEVLAKEQPDWIIHCAGNANVGLSVIDPMMDLNSSYVLLHKLLYAMKSVSKSSRLVFLSSAAVYGNPEILPVCESAIRKPVSPYGLHKAACEDLCEYFSRVEHIDCIVLRVFSAYGAGLRKQILWDLCNKIDVSSAIEMHGTGSETRDFIHVRDVVNAARLVLTQQVNGIYNIANGVEVRIDQIVGQLMASLGEDYSRVRFNGASKAGDPLYWKADISKIVGLGYSPTVRLDDGIDEYVQWRRRIG